MGKQKIATLIIYTRRYGNLIGFARSLKIYTSNGIGIYLAVLWHFLLKQYKSNLIALFWSHSLYNMLISPSKLYLYKIANLHTYSIH